MATAYQEDVAVVHASTSSDDIKNLTDEFMRFRDGASTLQAQIGIGQNAANIKERLGEGMNLFSKIWDLLVRWRQANNYPAAKRDGASLNEFRDLFREAYHAVQDYIECFELFPSDDQVFIHFRAGMHTLKEKLVSMSMIIEQQPLQTVKIKDCKGRGESEEPLSLVIRCLLPEFWSSQKPSFSVAIEQLTQASKKPCCKQVGSEFRSSSGEIQTGWGDQVEIKVQISGVKPTKKTDLHIYTLKLGAEDPRGGKRQLCILETLPILFYSHTTQIPLLSGHVMWMNAFTAVQVEDPFVVGETLRNKERHQVRFDDLYRVLDAEFHSGLSVIARSLKSPGKTDAPSDSRHRFNCYNEACLKKMLNISDDNPIVRKDALLKEKCGREKKFTVWEWFFACYKSKYEYFNELYEKGLVFGFIDKDVAERLLKEYHSNLEAGSKVFLMRFSTNYLDSHHGIISPSVIRTVDPEHSKPILSAKYKHDEKKLGKVLLAEMGVDDSKLYVVCIDEKYKLFQNEFKDFMEETETYEGYQDLSNVDGSYRESSVPPDTFSPRSDASSTLHGTSSPASSMAPDDFLPQNFLLQDCLPDDSNAMETSANDSEAHDIFFASDMPMTVLPGFQEFSRGLRLGQVPDGEGMISFLPNTIDEL